MNNRVVELTDGPRAFEVQTIYPLANEIGMTWVPQTKKEMSAEVQHRYDRSIIKGKEVWSFGGTHTRGGFITAGEVANASTVAKLLEGNTR